MAQCKVRFMGEIEMANIFIGDLQLAGSGLFVDSESFTDSIQDLSENELKMTFGGGKSGKSGKSKSSYSYSHGCPCPCPGGGSGGGGGAGA